VQKILILPLNFCKVRILNCRFSIFLDKNSFDKKILVYSFPTGSPEFNLGNCPSTHFFPTTVSLAVANDDDVEIFCDVLLHLNKENVNGDACLSNNGPGSVPPRNPSQGPTPQQPNFPTAQTQVVASCYFIC